MSEFLMWKRLIVTTCCMLPLYISAKTSNSQPILIGQYKNKVTTITSSKADQKKEKTVAKSEANQATDGNKEDYTIVRPRPMGQRLAVRDPSAEEEHAISLMRSNQVRPNRSHLVVEQPYKETEFKFPEREIPAPTEKLYVEPKSNWQTPVAIDPLKQKNNKSRKVKPRYSINYAKDLKKN